MQDAAVMIPVAGMTAAATLSDRLLVMAD